MGKRGSKETNKVAEATDSTKKAEQNNGQTTENLAECKTPVRTQAQKEKDAAIRRLTSQFKVNIFCGVLIVLYLVATVVQGITTENVYSAASMCFALMYVATCAFFTYRRLCFVKNSKTNDFELPVFEALLYVTLNNVFIFGMLICLLAQRR